MTDVTSLTQSIVDPHRSAQEALAGVRRHRGPGSHRHSRRRLTLFGLAGFAFALALVLPTFVYPRLTALPADPQRGQVLVGQGASVLVPDLESPAGARVRRADVTVRTFVSAADRPIGDSVVWQVASRTSVSGHGLLDARIETVSLNRHTGEPTNCCGDRLQTNEQDPDGEPLVHNGYLNFPLNVQKQDYPLWDIQLRRARTARFIRQENRFGMRAYVFRVSTPLTTIGSMELPGLLFRERTPSVTAASEYADTRTFWIEPNSSQVLAMQEEITQQFRYNDRVVPAMVATLNTPPPSAQVLSEARQAATILPWIRGRASIPLVLIGVILLAVAARWSARGGQGEASTGHP